MKPARRVRLVRIIWAVLLPLATCGTCCASEDPADLAMAKAIDQELRGLKDLSDHDRANAIVSIAQRVRKQPPKYAVPLALNLVIDGTEGSGQDTVQMIADTLSKVLADAPQDSIADGYRTLAELARYYDVRVSATNPAYLAALRDLESLDERRQKADFTLADIAGRQWTLRALRGKVVLVNFWATWCPPCRKELPDLALVYDRFKERGFVVLAITDEAFDNVRRFAVEQKLDFPILLDPRKEAKQAFIVNGIPVSFVFDREGRLVQQIFARPTQERLFQILERTGLK